MPQHRRAGDPPATLSDSGGPALGAVAGRRTRQRVDLLSDSRAAKVQRMLVLAERFRALVSMKSDATRLVDLLRNIITQARNTFGTELSFDWAARTVVQMAPDQQQCLRDLERLLQGLAHGSPDAWRGLDHAMDGLLIQCMLFETSADDRSSPDTP
jgi:hypothetical protein